ncbi:MAG: hypothetical protein FJW31_13870 [Acidobacteria bacterium]|nr:hypothetical protein [Acidobacteriota bacterium]
MKLEDLAELREYSGIFFDPATGKSYRDDGTDTGYTFENARWTGPFGMHLTWPWLNPIGFATAETATRILAWARSIAPSTLTVTLDDSQNIMGPFTRTIERRIVVSDGANSEQFSAGWLANSIIRNGETLAARSFQAKWRSAGLRF